MFDQAVMRELMHLLPAPGRDIASPPWTELSLPGGSAFPSGYRWFIEAYGYGSINDYLHVLALSRWSPKGEDTDAVKKMLHWFSQHRLVRERAQRGGWLRHQLAGQTADVCR